MTVQLAFDFAPKFSAKGCARANPAVVGAKLNRQLRGCLAHLSGEAAEAIVATHYLRRGFDIVEQRWRGPAGEIDLIVGDTQGYIFVEVKKSRTFVRAAESLGAAQMRRIYASAECFLGDTPRGQLSNVRFDVALVDGTGAVKIVENAFGMH